MESKSTETRDSAPISSTEVNGSSVFGTDGNKIGEIDHLMIDRTSGKITFAVMHFGGFLGLGEEAHPIPWDKLSYDKSLDGYRTDISEEQLKSAPRSETDWRNDRTWERRTMDHYAVPYYWI